MISDTTQQKTRRFRQPLRIALALFALFVAAAAGAQETITLWWESATAPHQQALRENLVEPFNAAQDDYELVVEFRGNDLDRQLRTAMLARRGPDLIMTAGPTYAAAMAEADQLLALGDYADEYGWNEEFAPVMLDLGTLGGDLYALPITYESIVLFYNGSLFEELGLAAPTTADAFRTAAQTLAENGIVPISAGNSDWRGANEWYVTVALNHIAGPDMVYRALTGEVPWTAPEFAEAITTLRTWWDEGWLGEDYFSLTLEQAFAETANRNAGMTINGTWAYQWLEPHYGGIDDAAAWTPIPSFGDDLPSPIYSIGIGTTLSINENSPNPDGAAAVLDYLTTPEFLEGINEDWPGQWNVPVDAIAEAQLQQVSNPLYASHVEALTENVAQGNYGYTTWSFWPPRTNQYLIEAIERVWLGEITVDAYLQELDAIFQEELQEGAVPAIPPRE